VTASYDKSVAVVVLPRVRGRLRDASLRHWLARADVVRADGPQELLATVLGEIDKAVPESGLAALRIWGQTGDRPTAWIAGADPVYMEPRLDHLFLHALQGSALPPADFRALFDHLQTKLADEGGVGFARVGTCGYVTAGESMATSDWPAVTIDQCEPDDYLPSGDNASMHRRLTSEIEMTLHDHAVNLERQREGLQPVNALWVWGGGYAPEEQIEPHPPLFSDDPLLRGYWRSKTAVAEYWPGSIAACIEQSVAGFVAVTPEYEDDADDNELLEICLYELRLALNARRLRRLVLVFRDGVYADVRRSQAVRIWRRGNALIDGDPVPQA
jgi:hypothetical protein